MKILRIVSYVAAVCAALMVGTLFGLRVERAARRSRKEPEIR